MPFGLQPIHLVIIAVVALLIFGPSRLPEIGRGVGRAITEFRRGAKEMTETFMDEVNSPEQGAASQPANTQPVASQPAAIQPPGTGREPVSANGSQPEGTIAVTASDPAAVETAASNFCIHCGKANPAGAVYCNQCGQKIAE